MLSVVVADDAVLRITPDGPNRLYPLGSPARLHVQFQLDPYPAARVPVRWRLGPEMLEGPENESRVPAEGLWLDRGALAGYPRYELDDHFRHHYRCVLPGQPPRRGVSIVVAALNPLVPGLAASFPACSDVSGYLHGRAGGWPGLCPPRA